MRKDRSFTSLMHEWLGAQTDLEPFSTSQLHRTMATVITRGEPPSIACVHEFVKRGVRDGAFRVVKPTKPRTYAIVDLSKITPQLHHTRR